MGRDWVEIGARLESGLAFSMAPPVDLEAAMPLLMSLMHWVSKCGSWSKWFEWNHIACTRKGTGVTVVLTTTKQY